jgi:hypothetical protein
MHTKPTLKGCRKEKLLKEKLATRNMGETVLIDKTSAHGHLISSWLIMWKD